MSDQVSSLEKAQKQILGVNDILVKSNKRYEERLQKSIQSLEYYKEYYHKHIEHSVKNFVTPIKTPSTMLPNSDNLKTPDEKQEVNYEVPSDKIVEEDKEGGEREGRQVNVSVLDTEEDGPQKENHMDILNMQEGNNIFKFTKEQCKIFLLNLAKELYVNTNISKSVVAKNILRRLEFGRNVPAKQYIIPLQRSVSNPLDYVSERKKLVFEPEGKDSKKGTKLKKQKKNSSMMDETKNQMHSFSIENLKFNESTDKFNSPVKYDGPFFGYAQDEMISFNVDADEFNKQKVVDVSFISNNDILDQIKHH